MRRLLLNRSTLPKRMKGNACWRKADARVLELGSTKVRTSEGSRSESGDKGDRDAAQAGDCGCGDAGDSRVVKLRVIVGIQGVLDGGRSRTPDSPARTLESGPRSGCDPRRVHAFELRAAASTRRRPASSGRADVHLKTASSAATTHHAQDGVGDLPAVERDTRCVEVDGLRVEPEKADVVPRAWRRR